MYLAKSLIPFDTSSSTGSSASPNLLALFFISFKDFLNLNSEVSATFLKASSHFPAEFSILFNVSENTFPFSSAIINPALAASEELHRALKLSLLPPEASTNIPMTSANELPSSINVVNDLPVLFCIISPTFEPVSPSSSNIALSLVFD